MLSTSGAGTNVGLFNTITGDCTIDTATFRNGAAALKTVSTTASAQHRVIRTLSSHTNQIGRMAIRISAAPATTATIMEIGDGAATITYHQFAIKPDRTIRAQWFNGTSTLSVDGPVLSVNTWYVLDWHFDGDSAAERRTEWRIDGAAQTAATAVPSTSATAAYTNTRIGAAGGNAEASNYTLWADDWIVSSTTADYPIGDGKVIALRPASDGTHSFTANDFSDGDAGTTRAPSYTSFYTFVDEVAATTARSTTDNITQRVSRTNGYVEINPGDTPKSGTANGVRALLAYSSPTTTANRMACIARTSVGFAGVIWGDLPVAQGGNGRRGRGDRRDRGEGLDRRGRPAGPGRWAGGGGRGRCRRDQRPRPRRIAGVGPGLARAPGRAGLRAGPRRRAVHRPPAREAPAQGSPVTPHGPGAEMPP